MINIAVSQSTLNSRPDFQQHVEGLLSKTGQQIFKVFHLNDIKDNNAHINVVNIDTYEQTIIENSNTYYIFIGNDLSKIVLKNNACNNYFVQKPVDYKKLDEILFHIRKKIQNNFICIQTIEGDQRLKISELNYVNIEGRNLCYHLTDGTKTNSTTLTTSFIKAITPLDQHELLLFIKPSLLINISKIKIVDTNRIIFDNKDWMPVSSPQRKIIKEEWEAFHDFDNRYQQH